MSEPAPSLLRRMAGLSAASPDADAPVPGLARAMAEAAMRAASSVPGFGIRDAVGESRRAPIDTALGALPAPLLTIPLLGHGEAWEGAVALDPSLSDALVEAATLGRVAAVPRPARSPTRIDATLALGFATAWLEALGARPGMTPLPPPDPGRHLTGAASLALEAEAAALVVSELTLTLDAGERTGRLWLILPDRPRVALPAPDAPRQAGREVGRGAGRAPGPAEAADGAAETLMAARVRLDAVLSPVTLTLAELMALRVGDSIDLPPGAAAALALRGGRLGRGGLRGRPIKARLGQADGRRAAKIGAVARTAPDAPRAPAEAAGPVEAVAPAPLTSASSAPVASSPAAAAAAEAPPLPDLDDLSPPELPDLPDLPSLASR